MLHLLIVKKNVLYLKTVVNSPVVNSPMVNRPVVKRPHTVF